MAEQMAVHMRARLSCGPPFAPPYRGPPRGRRWQEGGGREGPMGALQGSLDPAGKAASARTPLGISSAISFAFALPFPPCTCSTQQSAWLSVCNVQSQAFLKPFIHLSLHPLHPSVLLLHPLIPPPPCPHSPPPRPAPTHPPPPPLPPLTPVITSGGLAP
jgi:hypothetical protein